MTRQIPVIIEVAGFHSSLILRLLRFRENGNPWAVDSATILGSPIKDLEDDGLRNQKIDFTWVLRDPHENLVSNSSILTVRLDNCDKT